MWKSDHFKQIEEIIEIPVEALISMAISVDLGRHFEAEGFYGICNPNRRLLLVAGAWTDSLSKMVSA